MKRVICIRLFDLHCDTLGRGATDLCPIEKNDGAIDLRRGRAYTPWVQAFAAFVPDDLRGDDAEERCFALLNVAERWEREQPDDFRILRSLSDLTQGDYSCRALLTGENIGSLGDITCLDRLRARHMCAATLTWNGDNPWGCGCFGSGGGLTALGIRAIERMQALDITVDVSHLGECGFWDVARRLNRPFIATHSCSAAVTAHPRNLTDEQFCAVRDSGGVVGINLYHAHLGIPFDGDYLTAFARHLTHFLSLDGEDTVCIGTDLDGMKLPPLFDGMTVLGHLYDELLSRGFDAALLDKVFYTNAFRFFSKAIV